MCVELVTLTFIEKRCMKKKYTKRKKIQKIIPPEEKKKSRKKLRKNNNNIESVKFKLKIHHNINCDFTFYISFSFIFSTSLDRSFLPT